MIGSRSGGFATLYEVETTFEQVVSELALAPISSRDAVRIRHELGEVIGRGLSQIELSKTKNPSGRLGAKSIGGALKSIARNFQAAEPTLRGLETGLHQSHEIQAALNIRKALANNPEVKDSADEFLSDFCRRMDTISQACLVAAKDVTSTKRKSGQKLIEWHDNFTRVLIFISRLNNIKTTVEIDRISGKPKGRFLTVAVAFERLLYPAMRSPSRAALATRLSRSLKRIKKVKIDPDRDAF